MANLQAGDVTIANGASLSGAAFVGGRLSAIIMPAAWTAANLTFQGSEDDSTYNDLYDDAGTEYVVTAGASRYIVLDPLAFVGVDFVKIRSGTSATPVNQGAARVVRFVLRQDA